jgi:hypothetical protein
MTSQTPRHHLAVPLTLDQLTQLWLCDEVLTPHEQNRLWRRRTSGIDRSRCAVRAGNAQAPLNGPPGPKSEA